MGDFKLVKLLENPVVVEFEGGLTYKGEYDAGTTYDTGDVVIYTDGSSYVAIQETTGNLPTDTDYWQLLAMHGPAGSMTWKGAWVTDTSYGINDVVSNGDPASSYFCTDAHISGATTEPGVGGDWEEVWGLLAEGGSSDATKCTGEEINTGSEDAKFATPKAIADSNIAMTTDIPTVPSKATASEVAIGADDAKYITSKALKDADITATPPKATYLDINAKTEDAKFTTPLGIAQSDIAWKDDVPVKASSAEVEAGTDDEKFITCEALADSEVYLEIANNLSDLDDVIDARDNLELGTAATKDVGTSAGEVPILGVGGKIDEAVIPSSLINTVNSVDDITERDALTPGVGDVAVVANAGGGVSKTYIWDGTQWVELKAATGAVGSVNGKTGTVVVNKSDVGLGNVANALQLIAANNLSDLPSASTARTNLGLGTSATKNTGTAEGDVPVLTADNKLELIGNITTTENITASKKVKGATGEFGGSTTPPIKLIDTELLEEEEEGALEFTDDKLYFTNGEGRKEIPLQASNKIPFMAEESFATTTSGYYYLFGRYLSNSARALLTWISKTVNWGTWNAAVGSKAFAVTRQAGVVTGGDPTTTISLVVKGTSISDAGVRTASDSETLIADITTAEANKYYETTKRWIGTVTYEVVLTGTNPTTVNLEFNYGFALYYDCDGYKMTLKNLSAIMSKVGGSGSDSTIDVTVYKHDKTGWTYAQSGFVPGGTVICNKNTDYKTEKTLYVNNYVNYQRRGLNTVIDGTKGEGIVVEVRTTLTSAVTNGSVKLTFEI